MWIARRVRTGVVLFFWGVIVHLLNGCTDSQTPRNLILITVDTLRSDRLGCYGFAYPTSPSVDRFAEEAWLFENATAQASSTCPSMASLMTSRMPSETGVLHNRSRLGKGSDTLPELLSKKGFTTAAFVSNFVLRKGMGFERGFDVYDDEMGSRDPNRNLMERNAEDTTESVAAWLDSTPREPFFLWIHYQDPHGPYEPPVPYADLFYDDLDLKDRTVPLNEDNSGMGGIPHYQRVNEQTDLRSYVARYLGEIRYFDDAFGRLVKKLRESGLYSNTVVVFTADHGESLGEHEHYFAHGEYLYQDQIHVPLIIRIPGESQKRIEQSVTLLDLFPTLLGLAGVEVTNPVLGMDISEDADKERPVFAQTFKAKYISMNRAALIWKNYKIIHSDGDAYELYNLRDDPGEMENMKTRKPELLEAMKKILFRFLSDIEKGRLNPNIDKWDEETLKKMKSLGYW